MNSPNSSLAQHYFYLYDDEAYFYTWTDWSIYGGLASFYEMFQSEVLSNQEFDKRKIYSVYLGFGCYPHYFSE